MLVNRIRFTEGKRGDLGVEPVTPCCYHLICSMHCAKRRLEGASRGVLEGFARIQRGLLANDAESSDFLNSFVSIGYRPMSTNQLDGVRTLIGNFDCIKKKPQISKWFRTRLGETCFDGHSYPAGSCLGCMCSILCRFVAHAR